MVLIRLMLCMALLLASPFSLSESPLDISGLSTHMSLDEAVARAETLGGRCAATPPRRKVGGVRSQCYFSDCSETAPGANCERDGLPNSNFELAGQPVVSIQFEASAGDVPLTTIALFFAGDSEVVVKKLLEQFGPPKVDTAANTRKSWTEDLRITWRSGEHRVSLLNSSKMVLMVAEREGAKN